MPGLSQGKGGEGEVKCGVEPSGKGSLSSSVQGSKPKCQCIDCTGVTDTHQCAARVGGVEVSQPGNVSSDRRA